MTSQADPRTRRRLVTATAAVCGLALVAWAWARPPVPATVVLSIVGTTDLHGRLDANPDGKGGLAWFGGYLRNLRAARAADGGGVVLVDAGDTFQGGLDSNLSEGAVVIDAYNALGYTALAVGNHDFEYGAVDRPDEGEAGRDLRGALKARAAQAEFPFLAANLVDEATGRPVDWPNVRPSTLVEVAGVRVGIVGVMTLPALSMTLAANVGGLAVTPLAAAIVREATALRAAGAQVVVVGSHAGGHCEGFDDPARLDTCDPGAEMFAVLRDLPAGLVDAVVAGHTHSAVAHRVHGVPMVQAYFWGQAFGRIDLTVDTASGRVVASRVFAPRAICRRESGGEGRCVTEAVAAATTPVYEGREVTADATISAAMAPALQRVADLRATPLGVALDGEVARGTRDDESALGNLFADAMRAAVPGADAALGYSAGPGGLRAGLHAGPISRGALYDAFPFDNRVVRVEATGADLRRMLTTQLRRPRFRSRSLGVSGLAIAVGCGREGLEAEVRRASGAPIGDDERLVIATTDFMAARLTADGADPEAGRPRPAPGTYQDAPLVRDIAAQWLRGQPSPIPAARFADPAQPRWLAAATTGCEAANAPAP
ncbi:MAG: bifunctional UDP-sugar hydrolase/5'-nucleotidase [Vicinamibacterales bacterium]